MSREEVTAIPTPDRGWSPVIIATGPLTSDALSADIQRMVGEEHLSFYDAISPIVLAETHRHGEGVPRIAVGPKRVRAPGAEAPAVPERREGDYLNCPMTRDEYDAFYAALTSAESATVHDFDKAKFFEGCLPIEVMAHRGEGTLRFGPMKPVGLTDPRTGRTPYAVVQLRQDTLAGDHFSLVGFQTQIKWGDQARVLRMIPGLEQAEFVRFGMVHRNTYIRGPKVLRPTWQTRARPDLFFAGQVSGVEGYVESAASGLIAGPQRRRAGARARRRRRRRARRPSARWPTTCRTPTRRTTSRPTSRSASCRRSTNPPRDKMKQEDADRRARARRPGRVAGLRPWMASRLGSPEAMRDHLKAFLAYLKLNRNVSPHTVRAYESDVDAVPRLGGRRGRQEDLGSSGPPISTWTSVRSHLVDLNRAGKARASVARKLSALRTFVTYLRREDLIEHDPAAMAVAPKRDQTHPRAPVASPRWRACSRRPDTGDPLGPARPRHPRAVLRLGPAPERAGGHRPRRPEPARRAWCG